MSDQSPPVRRLADWAASTLRAAADGYGTPLYYYDLDRVRANARRLQAAFDEEHCAYAVKANAARPVLATLADAGLGAECASAGEVERALAAGFDGADVRYTAVNPPDRDLDRVVDVAAEEPLTITVGAEDTLERLLDRGYDGPLWVRANPGVGAGHHEKVTTGDAPQFGVPLDRVARVVGRATDAGLAVTGLHAHAGSGITSDSGLEAHRQLVDRMADLAREILATPRGSDLTTLGVGGGLGVPYRPDEDPLNLSVVARATRNAAGDLPLTIAVEPGRYLVADAGVLLTTVTTAKATPDTNVVGVDAGMTELLRPAMYDAHHEIRSLATDAGERPTVPTTVAGPVCETADVLARDRDLPTAQRGDVLAVGNAGAYGYEMASTYNSRPRPAVVVREGGTERVASRRETVADLTRLEREAGDESDHDAADVDHDAADVDHDAEDIDHDAEDMDR